MTNPLVIIAFWYIVGLLIGHWFLYLPWTAATVSLSALTSAIFSLRTTTQSRSKTLLSTAAAIVGAAAYIYSAAWFPHDHYTRLFPLDNSIHTIVGTIASPLDRDPDRTAFVISLREYDGKTASGRMRVTMKAPAENIGYKDAVRIRGRVYAPRRFKNSGGFDYPAYLAQHGIYRTAAVKQETDIEILERGRGPFRMIQDIREDIRRSFIASTNGPGSAVLQAMVLGEEGGLTDEVRDIFMSAGVTHILSISGSHLGLVAVICFGMLRGLLFLLPERTYLGLTLRIDPKKTAAWLTIFPVTFYAILAGGQTATMRSLIMILAGIFAVILDRDNSLIHSLAAAALIILISNPQAIFDISFQLSYISVLAIGYIVLLWKDARYSAESVVKRLIADAALLAAISIAAGLATAPLVAMYFNQISIAGAVSNMIVVPFAGFVVVPLGLAAGILSLFGEFLPFSELCRHASDLFYYVVVFFSRLPFAEIRVAAPNPLQLLGYYIMLISLSGYVRAKLLYRLRPLEYSKGGHRRYINWIFAGAAVMLASVVMQIVSGPMNRVTFVDVGQGDCSLIELSSGERILIDGGGSYDNRFDIGKQVVAPFLWNRGIRKLDLVILSHPHPDHMNGLLFILKRFDVREVWKGWHSEDAPAYLEMKRILDKAKIPVKTVSARAGARRFSNAVIRVMHPSDGFIRTGRRRHDIENNLSLVLMIEMGGVKFLFPGDCGQEAEAFMAARSLDLACDVLKSPHHGSKTSSTDAFLFIARPRIVVISTAEGNRYRLPSKEALTRYESINALIYRTDLDGAVVVTVSEGLALAETWRGRALSRVSINNIADWAAVEAVNWKRIMKRIRHAV